MEKPLDQALDDKKSVWRKKFKQTFDTGRIMLTELVNDDREVQVKVNWKRNETKRHRVEQ